MLGGTLHQLIRQGLFVALAFALAAWATGCKNDGPLSAPLNTAGASPAMPSPAGAGTASLAEDVAGHQLPNSPSANAATATPPSMNTAPATPAFDAGSPDPVAASAGPKLPAQSPAPAALPCDVSAALAAHCQPCHGDPPIGGAPMRLSSVDDFQRPASSQPQLTVRELALMRINDVVRPMPPGGALDVGARKTLVDWLSSGAPAAPPTAAECALQPTVPAPDARDPADFTPRPGETCYEFTTHGGQTIDDHTRFSIDPGELNEQFYFKVPWPAGSVATSMRTRFDNVRVLHHWLLFTTARDASAEGKHESVVGTQLGDIAQLIGSWALGGQTYEFRDDIGFKLPDDGMLNLQWHFVNAGSMADSDGSSVQICTVPASQRSKLLGITWLGTEYIGGPIGMPAHATSSFSGTCRNNSGEPITIWAFFPHMHKLGRHFGAVIKRADGSLETAFDKAFDYANQIHYETDPRIVLQPGDEITSTCTFDNVTDAPVPYGGQTAQEMCYLLAYAYPAGLLENHVISLIAATNTCW